MEQMNQDFQEWTRMFRNGPGLSGMNQDSSGLRWLSVKFCKTQKVTKVKRRPSQKITLHNVNTEILQNLTLT
jgi:hypothetical protein